MTPITHVDVPTSTIIPVHRNNRFLISVLRHQPSKHRGRLTCPGGKCTGGVSHEQTAREEFDQEVGGKGATIGELTLFARRTDRNADVREVSYERATDGFCPQDRREEIVVAHYGVPDYIYVATVDGEPAPKDDEARGVEWIDVRSLRPTVTEAESTFGAQHDLVVLAYRLTLDHGYCAADFDFSDFANLRQQLLAAFAQIDAD